MDLASVSSARPGVRRASLVRLFLAATCGGILAPLNSTMLAVALPDIREYFGISHVAIGWLVSSYLIAMAVAQPLGGRLGDLFGRASVFRWALGVFVVTSLAAAVAPTFALLVLLRTTQAVAGAAVIPNGLAMLREEAPPQRAGRVFGLNGAAMSCAAALGPLIGAGLLALGSWRAIFLMNIPVVAIALALQIGLPYGARPQTLARRHIDWFGAALFALTLVATTATLGRLRTPDVGFLALGLATLVLLALFAWRLRVAEVPTIEWRLFRQRSFAAGTAHILLTNLVMYTTLLTIPFFVEEVQHRGSAESGALLGVMSVLMTLTAPLSGWLSDRVGRRTPALVGSVTAIAGTTFLLVTISPEMSTVILAVGLAVIGVGVGVSVAAATTAAIESAPLALAGSASGTNSMMRYLGSIVGAGALAAVLTTAEGAPTITAFRAIVLLTAAMAIVSVPVAARIHRFQEDEAASRAS